MPMMPRGRWQVLLAVAGTLAAIELLLRLGHVAGPRLWRVDDRLGHALRAGATGWCTGENDAWVAVNAQGMRDRERSPDRTPNGFRVAVLGDDVTEARQLPLGETYPALLEKALQGRAELGGRSAEVLNFGVAEYSTGQELLQFRHVVASFRPDIVLLQFSAANDVRDNHPSLGGEGVRPYFRRDGRKVTPDERFAATSAHRGVAQPFLRLIDGASDYSHCVRLLASALDLGLPGAPGLSADERAFAPSPNDTWAEAWVLTERMLIALRDDCQASGARLMVVGSTYGPQVHPEAAMREELAKRLGQGDLLYPESRMAPFLVGNGIPFLPLAAVFQRRATTSHAYYHGFGVETGQGHWNAAGHVLAAELIAPWLLQHVR